MKKEMYTSSAQPGSLSRNIRSRKKGAAKKNHTTMASDVKLTEIRVIELECSIRNSGEGVYSVQNALKRTGVRNYILDYEVSNPIFFFV